LQKFFFKLGCKNLLPFIFDSGSDGTFRLSLRRRYEYEVPRLSSLRLCSYFVMFCCYGLRAIPILIGDLTAHLESVGVTGAERPEHMATPIWRIFHFFFYFYVPHKHFYTFFVNLKLVPSHSLSSTKRCGCGNSFFPLLTYQCAPLIFSDNC
jgi:hypothetical protein